MNDPVGNQNSGREIKCYKNRGFMTGKGDGKAVFALSFLGMKPLGDRLI
jgi:hypothetical protein